MKHTKSSYQKLENLAEALSFANTKADRRVQVKMPSFVVDLLDEEFPDDDRSKILTQAAVELLLRIKRLKNPKLANWTSQEQSQLDRMWSYLDERETS